MEIRTERNEKELKIIVEGSVDTNTAPKLNKVVDEELHDVEKLIFDLEKVPYISSAGLRVLLLAVKKMGKRESVVLRNVGDVVLETLEITGILDNLDIE